MNCFLTLNLGINSVECCGVKFTVIYSNARCGKIRLAILVQSVEVVKDMDIKLPISLENHGTEPAFNFKMSVTSGVAIQKPRGFDCNDETTNPEQVKVFSQT